MVKIRRLVEFQQDVRAVDSFSLQISSAQDEVVYRKGLVVTDDGLGLPRWDRHPCQMSG
jgi:hypothetical protein